MRKKIVAGNWKMNLEWNEAKALFHSLLDVKTDNVEVVVFPPYLYLSAFVNELPTSSLHLGAQNCHTQSKGAFTGEVAAKMLESIGVEYVLVGHSERRLFNKEDKEELKGKLIAAIDANLTPILCCGEDLVIREKGIQNEYIVQQLKDVLSDIPMEKLTSLVIAYEPVWAIGTGLTATSQQAEEMHANIRTWLASVYGEKFANATSILYGGSCNENNASELFACPNVDGGLIGGAALKEETFKKIIAAI